MSAPRPLSEIALDEAHPPEAQRVVRTSFDEAVRVEVDQKLATMVNDFNRLMDERRFAEAEL